MNLTGWATSVAQSFYNMIKKTVVILLFLMLVFPIRCYAEQPQPVTALYKFFDSGTDFQKTRPEIGPVGGVQFFLWEDVNPSSGVFNFDSIEQQLDRDRGLFVTLSDGTVVPKPIVILPITHISSTSYPAWSDTIFYDATPGWVYDGIDNIEDSPRPIVHGQKVGHVLTSGGQTAVLPAYDHWYWRARYYDLIRALGKKYDNDPNVTCFVVSTGLDSETHPVKSWSGVDWGTVLIYQASAVEYRFGNNLIPEVCDVYHEAFPNTALTLAGLPGEGRMKWADIAAEYDGHIGLHYAGVQPEQESYQGYGDWTGLWGPVNAYSDTLPIFPESVHDIGQEEWRYWAVYFAMHHRPVAFDMHPGFFELPDYVLKWANDHLGQDIGALPSAWSVLRDWKYPKVSWGTGGSSDKIGDWGVGLQRTSGGERVFKEELPAFQDHIYARQCRTISNMMYFSVSPEWYESNPGPYHLILSYMDYDTDKLSISWTMTTKGTGRNVITKQNMGWTDTSIILYDIDITEEIIIDGMHDGEEYIHKVEVYQDTDNITPVPTAIPTVQPNVTPTLPQEVSLEIRTNINEVTVNGSIIEVVDGIALGKIGPVGSVAKIVLNVEDGQSCGKISHPEFLRIEQNGCVADLIVPGIPISIEWLVEEVSPTPTPTPRAYILKIYWDDSAEISKISILSLPLTMK